MSGVPAQSAGIVLRRAGTGFGVRGCRTWGFGGARLRRASVCACVLAGLAGLNAMTGCSPAKRDERIVTLVRNGEYGQALGRAKRLEREENPGDRSFLLAKMRVPVLALAEGVPAAAREEADRVFDVLRTAGLNRDSTIGAFLLTEEGARIWKGDPFEQALAFAYIGMLDATAGEWGNVRAAANNSLFQLRDFSGALRRRAAALPPADSTSQQVDQRLALVQTAARKDPDNRLSDTPDALPVDYSPVLSDFELGYVLKAIACRQINEVEELRETIGQLVQAAPHLAPLGETIANGQYNTILVVSYGIAPEKIADGPDRTLGVYRPTTPSDQQPLVVRVNAQDVGTFPIVTDVNRMARDLKWNNLEDLRKAKSFLGNALLAGGTIAIAADGGDSNRAATYAGLGAILAGLALKATAVADTRQCDAFPQRYYVAPIMIPPAEQRTPTTATSTTVECLVGPSRVVLTALDAPASGIAFRYVRIAQSKDIGTGRMLYSNDIALTAQAAQGDPTALLPWILGGRDVRIPTPDYFIACRRLGLFAGMQFQDLLDLYKAEEIQLVGIDADATQGRHILEGGSWLYTPLPGTAGFSRLFTTEHPPFEPRSTLVRERAEIERRAILAGPPPEPGPPTLITPSPRTRRNDDDVSQPMAVHGPSPQEMTR